MNEDIYDLKLDDDPGYDSYLVPAFKLLKASQPPRDARMFRKFRDEVFKESPLVDDSNVDAFSLEVEKLLYAIASVDASPGVTVSLSSANGELLRDILHELWIEFHHENGYDQNAERLFYKDCVYNTLAIYTMPPEIGELGLKIGLNLADRTLGQSYGFELERNILANLKAKYMEFGVDLFLQGGMEDWQCLGVAMQLMDVVDAIEDPGKKKRLYGIMYDMFRKAGVARDPEYREIVDECRKGRI